MRNPFDYRINPKQDFFGLELGREKPHTCVAIPFHLNENENRFVKDVVVIDKTYVLKLEKQFSYDPVYDFIYQLLEKTGEISSINGYIMYRNVKCDDLFDNMEIYEDTSQYMHQPITNSVQFIPSNMPWPCGYRIKILEVDYILQKVNLKGPVDKNGYDLPNKKIIYWSMPLSSIMRVNGYKFDMETVRIITNKYDYSLIKK
jgi:hypothetical protein